MGVSNRRSSTIPVSLLNLRAAIRSVLLKREINLANSTLARYLSRGNEARDGKRTRSC